MEILTEKTTGMTSNEFIKVKEVLFLNKMRLEEDWWRRLLRVLTYIQGLVTAIFITVLSLPILLESEINPEHASKSSGGCFRCPKTTQSRCKKALTVIQVLRVLQNCHPHRQKLETPLTPSQLFFNYTELYYHSYYNYWKQVVTVCGKASLLGFWDCALPAPNTRTQLYNLVKWKYTYKVFSTLTSILWAEHHHWKPGSNTESCITDHTAFMAEPLKHALCWTWNYTLEHHFHAIFMTWGPLFTSCDNSNKT